MWSSRIKRLDEGNERVIAVTVAPSRPICLINAYMPTQDTGSQVEYSECLDIVHLLFTKFQGTYDVILCGDLNGTLLDSRSNKHDKLLKELTAELQLSTGIICGNKPTFYHHAGTSKSQIDYILVQDKSLISSYTILDKSPICSSEHAPVKATLTTAIHNVCQSVNQRQKKIVKLNWDRADRQSYRQSLVADHQVSNITESLIRASNSSVPKRTVNLKGPRWKASPKVKQSLKICKQLYSQWKLARKIPNHIDHSQLKSEKKLLRKQQRYEHAMDRKQLYEKLMTNPSSKLFYQLIKRNRTTTSSTQCLKVGDRECYSPEEQCKAFASYYEDLSAPKENEYEDAYLNLCSVRQNVIEQYLKEENLNEIMFTVPEVETSIRILNSGKSPDEYGLCAEHFKYGKDIVSEYITPLFNQILESKSVPAAFKTGILTPVLKKDKDSCLVNSYRGITVTAVMGKLFEYYLLEKLNLTNISELQYGFTKGLSPIMSSLIITEAKAEAKRTKSHCFLLHWMYNQHLMWYSIQFS